MASSREMRMRIKSVKDLSQVTRALKTVSASKVRKAMASNASSLAYSQKAWQVLTDLARQPGHTSLHPLLSERRAVDRILVVMVSGDKGLAGSYNMNILKHTLEYFEDYHQPIDFICIGKKGRDLLLRRKKSVIAEFSELNDPVKFMDISPVSRLVVDDFLGKLYDQVFIAYTRFESMTQQIPTIQKLLPLVVEGETEVKVNRTESVFIYEPAQEKILDEIVPRFTGIQIFQAVLSSQASEHAARTIAMSNATDNANELVGVLTLEYNKIRQQSITNDILDIIGGAAAHDVN
jgi:F-type H+-transporting ATPase subunit gamma